jgi:hypothetical protein
VRPIPSHTPWQQRWLILATERWPSVTVDSKMVDARCGRLGDVRMRGLLSALRDRLLEHPGHAADLAQRLSARLGQTWRVDRNDVYGLLDQLQSSRLAARRNDPARGTHRCLGEVSVACPDDIPRLLEALSARERECLQMACEVPPVEGAARSWEQVYMRCLRDAVLTRLRGEVEWLARTRRRITEHQLVAVENPRNGGSSVSVAHGPDVGRGGASLAKPRRRRMRAWRG